MSFVPICPYCNAELDESVPCSLQGSIQVKCTSCGLLYGYSKEVGSFPIDDEAIYQLSRGLFSKRIEVGLKEDKKNWNEDSINKTCIYVCLISPIIILIIILAIGFLLSIVQS